MGAECVRFHSPRRGTLTPLSSEGLATATMLKCFFHGPEGFVGKQTFAGNGCVFDRIPASLRSISFGKDGYVDAFVRIAALQQIFMWCDVGSTFLMYQDVVRTDRMFMCTPVHFYARVEKGYFYFCRTEG